MDPGELVASRYRVEEPLEIDGSPSAHFWGTDPETQTQVVLLELSKEEGDRLRPLVNVEHQHLARVLAIAEIGDKVVLVAERGLGPTLEEVLEEIERETPVEAVRSTLRVADAISLVHQAGGAHGFISPASLVVAPEGHAPPRLGFYPVSSSSPYRSPQRRPQGLPSESDDAWAITGLLYEMLVGEAPPLEGIANAEALEQAGVADPALRDTLLHGLNADPSQRAKDTTVLKRELARWFVDQATAEGGAGAVRSSSPPPFPSVRPMGANQPQRRSKGSRIRIPFLAVFAILLGLGASWAVSGLRARAVVEVPAPQKSAEPVASSAGSASSNSIDLLEVPVTGQREASTGNKMATCVAGYLPKGAFADAAPDLGWVCSERDPREGGTRLRSAVVAARPKDRLSEAMKIFGRLGWYEMAAFAVVYRGCCADSPPLSLPEPAAGCPRLDEALNAVGREAVSVSDGGLDDPLKAMATAIECEVKANRAGIYRHQGRPVPGEEEAFKELLKLIQAP